MQTLKTAIVVVLLLTVTYSAYVALINPPVDPTGPLTDLIDDIESDGFEMDFDLGEEDQSFAADFNTDLGEDATEAAPDPYDPPSLYDSTTPYEVPNVANVSAAGANSGVVTSDSGYDASVDPQNTAAESRPSHEFHIGDEQRGPTANLAVSGSNENAASGTFAEPGDFDLGTYIPPVSNAASSAASNLDPSLNNGVAAARTALANAIATADRQQQQDQLREALTTLSLFYNTPSLGQDDRQALLGRLDWLAGEVIYSTRHLIEQPYRVGQNETLESVAKKLDVPWQLLATINQIQDPARVFPGQELKVVRGPFRAEVNLSRSELTLMLGELYAGRFPLEVGKDPAPQPGEFTVQDKQPGRAYYALGGATYPSGDERNPYGEVWLDLGSRMCIHGSPRSGASGDQGCIRLAPDDAKDVYGILTKGSSVLIVR